VQSPKLEFHNPAARGLAAVVAPPHPLYGGRMENPVVVAVAAALGGCGYAPTCFNWRGVGESAGRPSGRIEDAQADYLAALEEAQRLRSETGAPSGRVLAAGYSFGAAAALSVALDHDEMIERLILVAPPVVMLEALDLASLDRPLHVIAGERDQFAPIDALHAALSNAREPRIDVIPDADHFFGHRIWIEKIGECVRAALA
jgi:alpha/beta superfamily hydrolase